MNLAALLVHLCPLSPKQIVEKYGGLLEGRELCELAVLASGVQVAYFTILNKALCRYNCTFSLYCCSQVLERSMGLHTYAINIVKLDCKLATSTKKDKKIC